MYKFLFIDCTIEPNGPGLPFIIQANNLVKACEKIDACTVRARRLKIYQMPTEDGLANFIGLHIIGEALHRDVIDFWNIQNRLKKRVKTPRVTKS